jgi:DhnA family fructose-bisphosphate aldolase class Ia
MINFVFMLTHHDRTVDDAEEVLADLRGTGLRYVGCKDVGATPERLRDLVARAHDDGLETMLEVVSTSPDEELASVRAAADAGFDWVLGGTNAADAAPLLAGTGIRYCPFPGSITGHPSVLEGELEEIAEHARTLTATPGIDGVDLLAYRHRSVDPLALTRAVVGASDGPVIVAGSIATLEQVQQLERAGAWGFTVGGAVFEHRFPGGTSVREQVETILRAADPTAA